MHDPFSPYALLKRSKPKPPSVYTTAYDTFSAAHQAYHPTPPPSSAHPAHTFTPESHQEHCDPTALSWQTNVPRTRYIAGIQQKHASAAKRTSMVAISTSKLLP